MTCDSTAAAAARLLLLGKVDAPVWSARVCPRVSPRACVPPCVCPIHNVEYIRRGGGRPRFSTLRPFHSHSCGAHQLLSSLSLSLSLSLSPAAVAPAGHWPPPSSAVVDSSWALGAEEGKWRAAVAAAAPGRGGPGAAGHEIIVGVREEVEW